MLASSLPLLCLLGALVLLGLALAALRLELLRERRRHEADSASARQWSRAIADAAFDGLLIHRQGLIVQMNRALVRQLGAREREFLGQNFANFARPDQAAALRAELEAPRPESLEFCLLRANKSELFVEISSQTIELDGTPATVTALRDITQRLADARTIAGLTLHDRLTGLPNRQRFMEALRAALAQPAARGGTVSLLILDIDRFKPINARFGRAGGDAVLKQAAQRLLSLTRREDLLARLGSDKFALMLCSPGVENRAASLAGQLIAGFAEPFILEGQLIQLSLSIGIATYPEHAAEADALLAAAEFALVQAEQAGGARAHTFCHTEKAAAARQQLPRPESELRQAIAKGAVELRFQPILRLPDLTQAGFEAQPHWPHPVLGLLGPERLFTLAAESGDEAELGRHLLREAVRQAAAAQATAPVSIAVSLTAAQLADAGLPETLAALLRQSRLDPRLLELGIAEALVSQPDTAATLARLAATGVRLALDRAGTAHAALGAIAGLRLSRLKIDASIIERLGTGGNAEAIAGALIALAAHLRIEAAAHGVDRPDQLDFLRRHHAHAAQGALFGPPLRELPPQGAPAAPGPLPRPALVISRP